MVAKHISDSANLLPRDFRMLRLDLFGNVFAQLNVSRAQREVQLFGEEIKRALEADIQSGLGNSRSVAAVITPSVPSLPMKACLMS